MEGERHEFVPYVIYSFINSSESPHSCGNVAITQYRCILNNDNELERKHFPSKKKFHHNFLYGVLTGINIYIKYILEHLEEKSISQVLWLKLKPGTGKTPGFPTEPFIFLGCSLKVRNGQIQKEYIYMYVCMHTHLSNSS